MMRLVLMLMNGKDGEDHFDDDALGNFNHSACGGENRLDSIKQLESRRRVVLGCK